MAKSLNAQPEAVSKRLEQARLEAQEIFHKVSYVFQITNFAALGSQVVAFKMFYTFGIICLCFIRAFLDFSRAGCFVALPLHAPACGA